MAEVTVIVVTYNGENWIRQCLNSIDISRYKVFVVDNASTDNTVKILKTEFPGIELLLNENNVGFGKANNIALDRFLKSSSEFVLLLNQDAWVGADTIDKLVKSMKETRDYWIISPLQVNSNAAVLEPQFNSYLEKNHIDVLDNTIQEIDFVNAAIWMMSRQCVLTVGGFDPLFPHYGEDNDYINRVHYWGGRVGVHPGAVGYHERTINESKGHDYNKVMTRNRLSYLCILKDINHSVMRNVMHVSVQCIRKIMKNLLIGQFRDSAIFAIACFKSFYLIDLIKARKTSRKQTAFLL